MIEDFQRFTEEQMGIFSEEDRANQYNAYMQCVHCSKWSFIIGTKETYGHLTNIAVCEHCGSKNMDSRSIISKRTFNPLTHGKRKIGYKDK
jgi:hypothetical protein